MTDYNQTVDQYWRYGSVSPLNKFDVEEQLGGHRWLDVFDQFNQLAEHRLAVQLLGERVALINVTEQIFKQLFPGQQVTVVVERVGEWAYRVDSIDRQGKSYLTAPAENPTSYNLEERTQRYSVISLLKPSDVRPSVSQPQEKTVFHVNDAGGKNRTIQLDAQRKSNESPSITVHGGTESKASDERVNREPESRTVRPNGIP